ncbi:MAG: RNA polymerase sigma factor [Clostridia bacterium]|nr:RNA polymerase sigma factor [Clostridia bacterium]
MDDSKIIELYWQRSECAISATSEKYGKYCYAIAYNILGNRSDSEECVNDTYLRTWESIPPKRPSKLSAYLGMITRNLSIDRYRSMSVEKRGKGQIPLVLDEMRYCFDTCDDLVDSIAISEVINAFLKGLSDEKRRIFLRRYWYFSSIKEIAKDFGYGESKVKMMLLRLREELLMHMNKEGYSYEK